MGPFSAQLGDPVSSNEPGMRRLCVICFAAIEVEVLLPTKTPGAVGAKVVIGIPRGLINSPLVTEEMCWADVEVGVMVECF